MDSKPPSVRALAVKFTFPHAASETDGPVFTAEVTQLKSFSYHIIYSLGEEGTNGRLTVMPDVAGEGVGLGGPGMELVHESVQGIVVGLVHRRVFEVRLVVAGGPQGRLLVIGVDGRHRRLAHDMSSPFLDVLFIGRWRRWRLRFG